MSDFFDDLFPREKTSRDERANRPEKVNFAPDPSLRIDYKKIHAVREIEPIIREGNVATFWNK